MQLANESDGQYMRKRGAQENGSSDFSFCDFLALLHQRHCVVMNGVGNLVTQRSGELFRVLYEIQERIDDVHIAARGCECVWLSFVNQIKLERVVVSRLRRSGNGVRYGSQRVVQR